MFHLSNALIWTGCVQTTFVLTNAGLWNKLPYQELCKAMFPLHITINSIAASVLQSDFSIMNLSFGTEI